jgi:hypothetical protein
MTIAASQIEDWLVLDNRTVFLSFYSRSNSCEFPARFPCASFAPNSMCLRARLQRNAKSALHISSVYSLLEKSLIKYPRVKAIYSVTGRLLNGALQMQLVAQNHLEGALSLVL